MDNFRRSACGAGLQANTSNTSFFQKEVYGLWITNRVA
nr:MAG TPA: hypothetical protein [Caudoviricetes sp.]